MGADGFAEAGEGSLNFRRFSSVDVRSVLAVMPLAEYVCAGGVSTGLMTADGWCGG